MPRALALVAGAIALLMLSPQPAAAAATEPLRLVDTTVRVSVDSVPEGQPVVCDEFSYACGFVSVEAVFSGLDGRPRPDPADFTTGLNLYGTVAVTRSYGCETRGGRRLHRYDRRVREVQPLNTRRGFPAPVPQTGDTATITAYTFQLFDSQPGHCPAGTQARMYRVEAKDPRLELVSRWAPIPSATYGARDRATWRGGVPTPVLPA